MDRKLLIRISAVVGALLLIGLIIALIMFFSGSDVQPDDNQNVVSDTQLDTGDSTTSTSSTSTDNGDTGNQNGTSGVVLNDRSLIISRANSFTERYGSYSSDTDFENVTALRSFMTDDMSKIADNLVEKQTSKLKDEFYGVTTQAISSDIIDYEDGATGATVKVSTRRTETIGTGDPEIKSETARLQLKKIGNSWKVDNFQWQ
ncbi:MAG: hypothetical protein Q8P90_00935 [bacterium]|nr:hypothetical protein [bacterium]